MPGGYKNIKPEDGVKFGEGQSRTGAGRPRKIYNILKEKGFSADDIKTAIAEIAWYDEKELRDVRTDKNKPIIVRIIATQLFVALEKADWNKVRDIIEHLIGKPSQPLEHKGEVNLNDARRELIKRLTEVARNNRDKEISVHSQN